MTGRIVVGASERRYEIQEHVVPAVQPGQVLLKVRLANICGSDVKIWAHGDVPPGIGTGHEFVGEICELGEGVTTDSAGEPVCAGDRVVCAYYSSCMDCEPCQEGDYQNCENAYRYRDIHWETPPHFHCAFSTHYFILPDQMFYKVPDELEDRLVVGVNCALSQVYGGIKKQLKLKSGETLLIQGCGGLGLYATAIAHELGAHPIVIDAVAERLALATAFGATKTINIQQYPDMEERVRITREFTGGKGVDKALELSGVMPAFEEGLRHLKTRGHYVIMGINVTDRIAQCAPGWITRKALCVQGVVRYDPPIIRDSLEFLRKTKDTYPYNSFCSEPFAMSDINSVIERMERREITRAAIDPEK